MHPDLLGGEGPKDNLESARLFAGSSHLVVHSPLFLHKGKMIRLLLDRFRLSIIWEVCTSCQLLVIFWHCQQRSVRGLQLLMCGRSWIHSALKFVLQTARSSEKQILLTNNYTVIANITSHKHSFRNQFLHIPHSLADFT